MKRLFLTSSVYSVANDVVKHCDLSAGNKLVFITTPVEPEMDDDLEWFYNDRQSLVDAGFDVSDYTVTGKTKEQLRVDLMPFDYIYVSGGNTWHLLQESRKSGFDTLIKEFVEQENKIYIGTSAGSIITGPKCPDYLLEEAETIDLSEQRGYELVNFTIIPHWGSKYFKDLYLKGRLEIAYKKDQVPLIVLTDNQYVIVEDENFRIVDIANRRVR